MELERVGGPLVGWIGHGRVDVDDIFPARPGTAVDPTCSIANARGPVPSECLQRVRQTIGHSAS